MKNPYRGARCCTSENNEPGRLPAREEAWPARRPHCAALWAQEAAGTALCSCYWGNVGPAPCPLSLAGSGSRRWQWAEVLTALIKRADSSGPGAASLVPLAPERGAGVCWAPNLGMWPCCRALGYLWTPSHLLHLPSGHCHEPGPELGAARPRQGIRVGCAESVCCPLLQG